MSQTKVVELENRGKVQLKQTDHVATGGEGSIYRPLPDTIIKIYSDTAKMIRDGMPEKLRLLSGIKHPFIVSPQGLVFQNQKPIGYYMKFEEGEPLVRVFTTSFRQREHFTDTHAITLVDGMKTTVETAHNHQAVLVDANEFNWLVSHNRKIVEPRVIDVDSWAIRHWKPSVIMPSIKDWHTQGFNDDSDWFAFAVVSFQIFTGIHPYKGMLAGYKPNDIETRMKKNCSVFSKGVRLNSAVRDFTCIPDRLLEWYEAVFQNGLRTVPPSPRDTVVKTPKAALTRKTIVGSTSVLLIDKLFDGINDTPLEVYPSGVVRMSSGRLINLSTGVTYKKMISHPCEIISTEYGMLFGEVGLAGELSFSLLQKDGEVIPLTTHLKGKALFRFQNRLFVVGGQGLTEVKVKQLGKPMLVSSTQWSVMLNSTQWFDGVGVQDALGATYLIAPFDEAACQYVHAPELNGKKIVSAMAGTRYIAVVVLDAMGSYKKYEFIFDKEYKQYSLRIADLASPDINMALLPKGVCATISEDGKLAITVPTNGQEKIVSDTHIKTAFMLANWENRVVFMYGNQVWSLALKSA